MYQPMTATLQELGNLILEFKQRTKKLRELSNHLGTSADTPALRQEVTLVREAGIALSKQIGKLLRENPTDRMEKVKQMSLAGGFQEVLKEFERINGETLEKEKSRIEIIKENVEDEEFRRMGTIKTLSSSDPSIRQQSVALFELGFFSEVALRSMQEEASKLESEIQQVNALFQDMATFVQDQGNALSSIEAQAEVAVSQSGKAAKELAIGIAHTAEKYQSKSSRKWLCLALILIIVVFSLAAILYFAAKSRSDTLPS